MRKLDPKLNVLSRQLAASILRHADIPAMLAQAAGADEPLAIMAAMGELVPPGTVNSYVRDLNELLAKQFEGPIAAARIVEPILQQQLESVKHGPDHTKTIG